MSVSPRPVTAGLQKIAIEELNEVPQRVQSDIEALQTWIGQQPHLRARTDAQFLVAFLRGCKYSIEKAKSKIDRFYTMRSKYPEIFRVTDVNSIFEILETGVFCFMPNPINYNGPALIIFRLGAYPAETYAFGDVIKMTQTQIEITLRENDNANINGVVALVDVANLTANHIFQYTPSLMKKHVTFSEKAVPIRPKSVHFINVPSSFDIVYKFVKPMLMTKLQNRITFHNDMESLYRHIPREFLPLEYGGENSSLQETIMDWKQRILNYREYFEEEASYGTNEILRPGEPIDFENIFGVQGSFRKMELD